MSFVPPVHPSPPPLASRKPPSEAACQVCLNLHSWVILPSKASLRQDVFRVKIFNVNAIGEQSSHACRDMQRNTLPASAAAALVSEVSPTWLSHGPTVTQFTSAERTAFPPSFHSQDVFPPDPTARSRVILTRACAGGFRRSAAGSAHSWECIARSK